MKKYEEMNNEELVNAYNYWESEYWYSDAHNVIEQARREMNNIKHEARNRGIKVD